LNACSFNYVKTDGISVFLCNKNKHLLG